ncbi:hypothetical protein [Bacteroides acidifaciens]|uniref:hypothetical protein n=1 Tax=Bacteroides acidifaciens TaxID=85831 RepID=UPI00263AC462|nr:hypothetical protein [Bacteroides acidifaciens]
MYVPGAMIQGTMFITNEKELVYRTMADPRNHGKCMVLDMDEQDDSLEQHYPTIAAKATILLPPTTAVFREIDGDSQGFIMEYHSWLHNDTVEDFISAIILMMCRGYNVLLYAPSYSEDTIWVNELLKYFEMTYGLHVGTSAENGFVYNPAFDPYNLDMMYFYCCISVMDYLAMIPPYYVNIPLTIMAKLNNDLATFSGGDEPIDQTYNRIRYALSINPNMVPAVSFD